MKVVIEENLNHVFVTADHHLRHENILGLCERPFRNVLDMDKGLINNWNEVVRPQDLVIHLADFTLEGGRIAQECFAQLNGDICVLSNPWHHDKRWLKTNLPLKSMSGFDVRLWLPMVVLEIPQLGKDGYPLAITLCHYPLAEWERKHHGAWHLHGHSHGNYVGKGEILDVGVDCHGFYPVSLAEISFRMLVKDIE